MDFFMRQPKAKGPTVVVSPWHLKYLNFDETSIARRCRDFRPARMPQSFTAITEISTRTSLGKPLTSTVSRAGKVLAK